MVTHGARSSASCAALTGLTEPLTVPLCCIFTLQRDANGWHVVQRSVTSHLSNQETSKR